MNFNIFQLIHLLTQTETTYKTEKAFKWQNYLSNVKEIVAADEGDRSSMAKRSTWHEMQIANTDWCHTEMRAQEKF